MEILSLKNVSYTYPQAERPALHGIDLSLQAGEFLLLCGPSGCGKTTLLRQLVPALQSRKKYTGSIQFAQQEIQQLSAQEAAQRIGLLRQNVDAQIVTDTVQAELAFGLECTGVPAEVMRQRIAELVTFLGISSLIHRRIETLSGGEKQLVSLAAILATRPDLLLLDEPLASLDPVSIDRFLSLLVKIHRELGLTILLAEQHLDVVFSLADRVAVLQQGKLLHCAGKRDAAALLAQESMLSALLPRATQVYLAYAKPAQAPLPLTVQEARKRLPPRKEEKKAAPSAKQPPPTVCGEVREVAFRFSRDGRDVLADLSLEIHAGECLCILGGNGAGKTTLLRLLHGALRPYRGKIKYPKGIRTAYLPQNARLMFQTDCVMDELWAALQTQASGQFLHKRGIQQVTLADFPPAAQELLRRAKIVPLLQGHPFDLSAGEQQRVALVKLLLQQPDVLLLDEPTQGLDAGSKQCIQALLHEQGTRGRSIVMATHDLEFAARAADRCALLFAGEVSVCVPPERFFADNLFYTTVERQIFYHVAQMQKDENA